MTMFLWLELLLCTAAIVYSGARLSRYGDIIAEKTGIGKTWTGVILMASVTSLPELVTGISSVTFSHVPDIAVGDVLGSCAFNMLILALLDAMHRPMPISTRAHHGHVLSAGFGILLLSIVSLGISLSKHVSPFGWMGLYSLLFITVYLVAMRSVYSYEKRQRAEFVREIAEELKYGNIPAKKAVLSYSVNAVVVIIAALFLPGIGGRIAEETGLGQTFVGNILIALSTSLPEVVVSVAAVRIGSVDLAIGNLFGSNIFNVFILAIDDMFFTKGPILSFADPGHLTSALSAIAMTAIAVIGLTYRAEQKRLLLAWDSLAIIMVYITNMMLLYHQR
jgi:cation:H+ antiporter